MSRPSELEQALGIVLDTVIKQRSDGKKRIIDHVSHIGTAEELAKFMTALENTKNISPVPNLEASAFSQLLCLLIGYQLAANRHKNAN